jgi:hypothetical protein
MMTPPRTLKVGARIKLATDPLTKHYGVGGTGVVTAVRVTDPVNRTSLVVIRTASGYLHLNNVAVTAAQPKGATR